MPGLFNRLKTWAFEEVVKNADLNGEFNNIINHMIAQYLGGYSASLSQFQTQVNPGATGSESLSSSTADEIARLRFQLAAITGNAHWNDAPVLSLLQVNTLFTLAVNLQNNRILSGKTRATSNQPIFLHASGSTPQVILKAAVTPFKVKIKNVEYDFIADTPLTIPVAPNTANTATVNNGLSALNPESVYAGESDWTTPTLTLAATGANIAAQLGKYTAFKVVDGANTEYFFGYVNTAVGGGASTITKAYRGWFFDSTDTPSIPIALTDTDVVTLLRVNYIFATTSLSLAATQNIPVYSATAPASPSSGDYWFDLSTQVWMVFNGVSFVDANATLIGIAITDGTNCIAARSFEFFAAYAATNTISLEQISSSAVRSSVLGSSVNVAGSNFSWMEGFLEFDVPVDLVDSDGSASLSANTTYFLYVTDQGKRVVSTIRPMNRLFDLFGRYHKYSPWRCVGQVTTDGSSNFIASSVINMGQSAFLAPNLVQQPTFQVFNSGFGVTYTTPVGVKWLEVTAVGGGGGGGSSGAAATAGSVGNSSQFKTAGGILLAQGGGGTGGGAGPGSSTTVSGGAGGTSALGTGIRGLTFGGGPGQNNNGQTNIASTAMGGSGALFGGGGGGRGGVVAPANSGGGGGSSPGSGSFSSGSGGGGGGAAIAIITYPLAATYSVTVGSGGAGGTGGNGTAQAGADGVVIVKEYYF